MSIVHYEGNEPWWVGKEMQCNRCDRNITFERYDFEPEAYHLKSVKYCCKNCGYAYTNQTKSKITSVGHSQFREVDMLDCTPEPPDFYLRPETQLNFDHK